MIKDKLDLIVRIDKNQEEINSIHSNMKSQVEQAQARIVEEQEESVDEFDQEYHSLIKD